MNEIVNFLKGAFNAIVAFLSGILDVKFLLFAGIAFLIGWLARPGKGLRSWNMPWVTMLFMVLMVFFLLQSLVILKGFGWTTTDSILTTLIGLMIGCFWLFNFYGGVAKWLWLLGAALVIVAIFTYANAGPSASILASFIRAAQTGFGQILHPITHA